MRPRTCFVAIYRGLKSFFVGRPSYRLGSIALPLAMPPIWAGGDACVLFCRFYPGMRPSSSPSPNPAEKASELRLLDQIAGQTVTQEADGPCPFSRSKGLGVNEIASVMGMSSQHRSGPAAPRPGGTRQGGAEDSKMKSPTQRIDDTERWLSETTEAAPPAHRRRGGAASGSGLASRALPLGKDLVVAAGKDVGPPGPRCEPRPDAAPPRLLMRRRAASVVSLSHLSVSSISLGRRFHLAILRAAPDEFRPGVAQPGPDRVGRTIHNAGDFIHAESFDLEKGQGPSASWVTVLASI